MSKKLLVIDVAALGWNMAAKLPGFQSTQTVFPAVTCTAQASFRTAAAPAEHGMVANGLYYPTLRKVLFWEQSSALVQGRRIWEDFRARGKKVGLMFWQQAMGEDADLIFTPAPIHKHSGGMIQSCYTLPAELEDRLSDAVGRPFNLMNYWGPLANHKSSDWIVDSIIAVLGMPDVAPDLLLTYIPHLDYDLQRYGPESPQAQKALDVLEGYLTRLKAACQKHGYDWLIFGDYAIEQVRRGAIFPNIALREAGLLATRDIRGMAYAVIGSSRAFAMVDHQVAHVICKDEASTQAARKVLEALPGVSKVLDRAEQAAYGLNHPNSGDLVVLAEDGAWFAYPWFTDKSEAPDYASHVDIHNKPGFDPCELFFGWPPGTVSMNTEKIRGSHGNVGTGFEIGWSSSLTFPTAPASLLDLARFTEEWMQKQA